MVEKMDFDEVFVLVELKADGLVNGRVDLMVFCLVVLMVF